MTSLKKHLAVGLCAASLAVCAGLSACGGAASSTPELTDGSYTGKSSVMEANVDGDGYVTVDLTVKDGKVSDVEYKAFLPDGTKKDESYGKDGTSYALAQKVLQAADEYADELLQSGSTDGIDVVSGATYLHDQFVEAVEDALDKAAA